MEARPAAALAARTPALVLQRKCACGGSAGQSGECEDCRKKKLSDAEGVQLQARLAFGTAGDAFEREADCVADEIMRMPSSSVGPGNAFLGAAPLVQRRADAGTLETRTVLPIVRDVLSSPGAPLNAATRTFFERRLGYDFGKVRVHADARAAESSRAVNALAYTVGSDVVFASGQYAPGTRTGQKLLAHELTHVVQQTQAASPALQRQIESQTSEAWWYAANARTV